MSDDFEAWWAAYRSPKNGGNLKATAKAGWDAANALDTSPWLDKTKRTEPFCGACEMWPMASCDVCGTGAVDPDGVDPFTEAALHSTGEARARLEAAFEKLNRKGICDACSATVPWDDLYIISTPQLSGVAMCMECRLISGPYCEVPPEGWWCSRLPKHEGPCAARPDDGKDCRTCGKKRCLCQLDLFPDGGHK